MRYSQLSRKSLWRIRTGQILMSLILMSLTILSTAHATADPELRRLLKAAIASDVGFEDRFDAEVWLLDMSQRLEKFVPDPKIRIEMLKQVHFEATRVNVEPELVLALIEVESHFNEYAISVAGARGLM